MIEYLVYKDPHGNHIILQRDTDDYGSPSIWTKYADLGEDFYAAREVLEALTLKAQRDRHS